MRRTSRATSPPSPCEISSSIARSRRGPGYAKKLSAGRSAASAVSTAARPALSDFTDHACVAATSLYQRSSRASPVENSRSIRSEFDAAPCVMISPRSQHGDLVVEDEPERLHDVLAAVLDVGVAESELKPLDPGDVPGDVEVAFMHPGKRAVAATRGARVRARGVAQEHRQPGDGAGQQRSFVEAGCGAEARRVLTGAVEVFLLKRQVARPGAERCLQCRATAGRVEGRTRGEAP